MKTFPFLRQSAPLLNNIMQNDPISSFPLNRFNILFRANSFLKSNNLNEIEEISRKHRSKCDILKQFFELAPISISHLDQLYYHTIYTDGPFNIIDFLLETPVPNHWIQSKLTLTTEAVETNTKIVISNPDNDPKQRELIENWLSTQPQNKPTDPDLISLRTLETLILMAIINFQNVTDSLQDSAFKLLEEKLIDWSEGAGLIRSLSDNQISLAAESSMDIDFNSTAETSTFFLLKQNEFDVYLLEKFKSKKFKKLKEIVEIVSDRCGIPVDSDSEEAPKAQKLQTDPKQQAKHWRRVKPVTLPIKRVSSSKVTRSSSLTFPDVKSTRFSSSSSRQVDLTLKPPPPPPTSSLESNSFERSRRRGYSETSAPPQILQQTTPTKTKKSFNSIPAMNSSNTTNLADSFVILETPPRILSKNVPENDISGSVRRLFQPNQMEE